MKLFRKLARVLDRSGHFKSDSEGLFQDELVVAGSSKDAEEYPVDKEEVQRQWQKKRAIFDKDARRSLLLSRNDDGPCQACQAMVHQSIFSHHTSADLAKSAEAGCPVCNVIKQGSAGGFGYGSPSTVIVRKAAKQIEYQMGRSKRLVLEFFNPSTQDVRLHGLEGDKSWRDFISMVTASQIQPRPDTPECYSLVRSWIHRCISRHPRCDQSGYSKPPTRLLEIVGDMVYLRESMAILQSKPQYTTLTYCWGLNTTLQTTKSTIGQHKVGIKLEEMPPTLRDAVIVTRTLGIDYIWIDALCIVQDAPEDWETECSRMGEYYRFSYVTISPLDAAAADSGFLQPRPPVLACQTNMGGVMIGLREPVLSDISGSPLGKRGWTLQERLLSTRILHYGKHELLWECMTCSAREGSEAVFTHSEDSSQLVTSEGIDFKRCLTTLGGDPHSIDNGAFSLWYRMVRLYTTRSLTYPSDKLPAVSAIARVIGDKTRSRYMWGIFQDDLHALAWSCGVDGAEMGKALLNPSWSWASADVSVKYPFYSQVSINKGGDAQFLSYDNTTKGQVYLEVRARWASVTTLHRNFLSSSGRVDISSNDRMCEARAFGAWDLHDVKGHTKDSAYSKKLTGVENVVAVCICDRRGWATNHADRGGCECRVAVEERFCYLLLLVKDGSHEGCWRRIGLAVTVSAPQCSNEILRAGFEGVRWANFKLL